MKKIIVVLVIVFIVGCTDKFIGGHRDRHGCLGDGGYSWNEEVGACIREWKLDGNQKQAAKISVAPLSYSVTITQVDVLRCPGCFMIHMQRNDNSDTLEITLENLEVKDIAYNKIKISNFQECVDAGNPVMESYPRQCRTDDGKTYTEALE